MYSTSRSISRALRSRQILPALRQNRGFAVTSILNSSGVPSPDLNDSTISNPPTIKRTVLAQPDREQREPDIRVGNYGIFISWNHVNEENIGLVPNFWLRDHCHCSKCINQDTMQRSYDTFSQANREPKIKGVTKDRTSLCVTWLDDHVSTYTWQWLRRQGAAGRLRPTFKSKNELVKPVLWDATIKQDPPSVQYSDVMANDAGVGVWTDKIRRWGFCFVDGVPPTPEATETLLQRIAFIRVTHYGGFYDFTSDLTMKDTAYTSLALPAHTDTTYFSDPAGLQMFHLLSHTSGHDETERTDLGGASLLVDGFACAQKLHAVSKDAFKILSQAPIQWHASGNEGIIITPDQKRPVLSLGTKGDPRTIMQVRWNNDDRATVPLILGRENEYTAGKWYEAAALWHEIVTSQENEYWEQLKPGRALIFDNWRVMHGRSEFTGKRRMSGGYINRDDFISRYLNTNFHREEILEGIL